MGRRSDLSRNMQSELHSDEKLAAQTMMPPVKNRGLLQCRVEFDGVMCLGLSGIWIGRFLESRHGWLAGSDVRPFQSLTGCFCLVCLITHRQCSRPISSGFERVRSDSFPAELHELRVFKRLFLFRRDQAGLPAGPAMPSPLHLTSAGQ